MTDVVTHGKSRFTTSHLLALWHVTLALFAVAIVALATISLINFEHSNKGPALDFVTFWTAARLALHGQAALAYDPTIIAPAQRALVDMPPPGYFPFFYPPIALLLFMPFALLPYGASFLAFGAVQWAMLVVQLRRLLPRPWPLSTVLAAPAILVNFGIGQNGCLTASFMAAAAVMLDRRPTWAGFALGFVAFKPQVALLIPMALLIGRRWRALISATATSLALGALTLFLGVDAWTAFLLAGKQASLLLQNFPDDWSKMVTPYGSLRLAGFDMTVAFFGQTLTALAALWGLALCYRVSGKFLVAALAAATMLESPHLLDYDLPISLIPLVVVIESASRRGWLRGERLTCLAAFLLPLFSRFVALAVHVGSAPIVEGALMAVLVRRALHDQKQEGGRSSISVYVPPENLLTAGHIG